MTSNIDDNAADQPATGVGDSDETTAGPANDETVVVADSGQTQLGWLAWSEGDDPDESEPGRESWRAAWGTAALLAVSLTALAVAVGFGLWAIFRIDADRTPGWTPPSIQPAASLPPISTPAPTSTVTVRAGADRYRDATAPELGGAKDFRPRRRTAAHDGYRPGSTVGTVQG
jgi:hypothetical protein